MKEDLNNHIVEFLDFYLFETSKPGYAVFIDGSWGSGKTFFIKNYIDSCDINSKFLYVSLYGINNVDQINDFFFQQLHPNLASKPAKFAGVLLKGVLRATLRLDISDFADNSSSGAATIKSPIDNVELPEYLKEPSDSHILVFDDLERADLPMKQLLGYINEFIEHQEKKVIILADEKKIGQGLGNGRSELEKEIFNATKEKIIGRSFAISCDSDSAFDSFSDSVVSDFLRTFIKKNRDHWLKIFYESQPFNSILSTEITYINLFRYKSIEK